MNKLNPLNFLPGNKTYVTGFIAVIAGVTEVLSPGLIPVSVDDPGQLIVLGLGMIFLRKGMKNET